MKKILAGILAVSMIGSANLAFATDTDKITVKVNGEEIITDVAPVMENDRILLPMRAIFETLGCNVSYRVADGSQFVTAFHGDRQVVLEIGKKEITVDGETKALDVAAKIENDRTLVPVRAVSEAMDADVKWDGETNTAEVTTKQGEHKIGSVTDEKVVKDEDGTVLMYINYVYPIIENKDNNEYIGKINDEYKAYTEKFIADAEERKPKQKRFWAKWEKTNSDRLNLIFHMMFTQTKTAFCPLQTMNIMTLAAHIQIRKEVQKLLTLKMRKSLLFPML